MIFQENGLIAGEGGNKKVGGKRQSAREKKPVNIQDLGYVDKEQLRKGSLMNSEGYKKCERLLTQLKKHSLATNFMVAPTNIPEYTMRIKEPMDLMTVEKKLKSGQYHTSFHFALDIRKIWNNSWLFNKDGTELHNLTNEISTYFEKLMLEVGEVQFVTEGSQEIQHLKKKIDKVQNTLKRIDGTGSGKGMQRDIMDRPMTTQEKTALKNQIMNLSQDKLAGMIKIIQDTIDMSNNSQTLEFDIDSLTTRKCRELEQYVNRVNVTPKSAKKKPPPKTMKAPARSVEVIKD
jgi:hypothetical protein